MSKPPSRYRAFEVSLTDHPGPALTVRRAPTLLRFVVTGDDLKTLDALDQLDDTPKATERVIAAERVSSSPVHFKFSGKDKQKSGWYLWVQYKSVAEQPPEAVLRDTEAWRGWCLSQPRTPSS